MSIADVRSEALSALADRFQHVFVLTIDRNANRRATMKTELHGLAFEYFYGVDARELSSDEIDAAYDDVAANANVGRSMEPGEIATALSFRMLFQHIIDMGYESALVFEDDARMVVEEAHKVIPVLDELPDDWELLYFGHRLAWGRPDNWTKLKIDALYPMLNLLRLRHYEMSRIKNRYLRRYSKHLNVGGSFVLAHSFAIRRSLAEKVTQYQTPIVDQSDGALRRICTTGAVKTYSTLSQLFIQDPNLLSSAWNFDVS